MILDVGCWTFDVSANRALRGWRFNVSCSAFHDSRILGLRKSRNRGWTRLDPDPFTSIHIYPRVSVSDLLRWRLCRAEFIRGEFTSVAGPSRCVGVAIF